MIVVTTPTRRRLVLAALAALSSLPVAAQDARPPYDRMHRPSPGGIGKRYLGREISGVMGFEGASWLERDEREREERTDLLVPQLQLAPGMTVADIGAGTGYFARRIAPVVGANGKVYAVDVQPQMVRLLQALSKQPGMSTIEPVHGARDDVKLPAASIDVAVMVDVYHELEYPYEVMQSLVRALKPGGRVVFVEYRAEDPKVPIRPLHKMSEAQIRREAAVHALQWERTVDVLPWQHIVVFGKR